MIARNISEADFERFREYFYRQTGIRFESSKRYFVDRRLLERMDETSSLNFRSYFDTLRADPNGRELQQLTNLLTVNETYFFREQYQFDCLVNSILPKIVEGRTSHDPIRIWVIPCSSGEEPYSVALTLLERWPLLDRWDVEIVASDIDTSILDQARRGLYSARSVHQVPPEVLRRYFSARGDAWQLAQGVRDSVRFTRANLIDPEQTAREGGFDVVFCRNLLIYFDDRSRRSAAENIYDACVPGAYVCLGHTESMSRISSMFQLCSFPEAIVYQKPREPR